MARTNLKQALVAAAIAMTLVTVSSAYANPQKISVDGRIKFGRVIRLGQDLGTLRLAAQPTNTDGAMKTGWSVFAFLPRLYDWSRNALPVPTRRPAVSD
jgi:hypothetical protein